MQRCSYITVTLLSIFFKLSLQMQPSQLISCDGCIWRRGLGLVYIGKTGLLKTIELQSPRKMVVASLLSSLLLALAISIAAKPVLEQNSPMGLPLMKRRSLSKYDIVELDWHRLNSLRRRSDFDSTNSSTSSRTNISGKAFASYQISAFYVIVGVGDKNCKWLQCLVAG